MTTHYEVLGVAKDATQEEIKKAYRKLASTLHPDKGGDTAKFQAVQGAYAAIETPEKRAQYDAELSGGGRQFRFNTHDNGDMEDILNHMRQQFGFSFGGGPDPFAQANRQRKPANQNVKITVTLDLISTLEEQTKTLNVTLPGNTKENIEIKIPRGVQHGATVRYAGLGAYSVPDAPRGDLYVQFLVIPLPNYQQHGIDLVTELTINSLEAMLGCEKEVAGIDGKQFKITIPPGTQFGSKFGIPDQGIYTTNHPSRGRLIVIINIYILKEFTPEQLESLKAVAASL